jgi:hypothetical protein
MAFGLDTADRLDSIPGHRTPAQRAADWHRFLHEKWTQSPSYVGRYFGITSHDWIPGELTRLAPSSELATNIRFIFPFAPTGAGTWHLATDHPDFRRSKRLEGHGLPEGFDVEIFFNQEGTTSHGTPVSRKTTRDIARNHAIATGKAIQAALDFRDPVSGQPELVLPPSGKVFVFLDVEPQTQLSHFYWLGWAETISAFIISSRSEQATINVSQPLAPCLYCAVDDLGPFSPEITGAFTERAGEIILRSRHTCHALASGWNFISSVAEALAADETAVWAYWDHFAFGSLEQPSGPDAPLVIWQHRFNIGMDAAGNVFSTVHLRPPGAGDPVFQVDLSITAEGGYDGRPITDFMLWRPGP